MLFIQLDVNIVLPITFVFYALIFFLNIVAFEVHKKIIPGFFITMTLTYSFAAHIIFLTGGLRSGFDVFLVVLSFVSYVFSRKQGRIGFAITIFIFLSFFIVDLNGVKFEHMVHDDSIEVFNLYSVILSCTVLGLFFGDLLARTTYRAFKDKEEIQTQHNVIQEKNAEIEMLSILANQSKNSMVTINLEGDLVWMNDIVKNNHKDVLSGTGLKSKLPTVFSLSKNESLFKYIEKVKDKSKALSYESVDNLKGKDKNWTLSTISPLYDADGILNLMSIVDTDITDQKETEDSIRVKNEELHHQNEEIMAQRDQINIQKKTVESQKDEIISSINYAKRIQSAVLKFENQVTNSMPENFIIYKPKDIVSGDFYWVNEKNGSLYMAVGDCTGHGVPGAMLAMLGASYLNEICSINRVLQPSFILDELRDKFIHDLAQDGTRQANLDGMDVSLVRLDLKTLELEWSGANNPLYLAKDGKIEITKGNKQHIGYTSDPTLFDNHKFQLGKGDTIYLFSDGYPDQFGGDSERKFGYKTFRDLISNNISLSLPKQKQALLSEYDKWVGSNNAEQTDDICIVGLKM